MVEKENNLKKFNHVYLDQTKQMLSKPGKNQGVCIILRASAIRSNAMNTYLFSLFASLTMT